MGLIGSLIGSRDLCCCMWFSPQVAL